MPLLQNKEKPYSGTVRLENKGKYKIKITDVLLVGDAYQFEMPGWHLEPETELKGNGSLKSITNLQLTLKNKNANSQNETIIVVVYDYGLLRRNLKLEIKTELP